MKHSLSQRRAGLRLAAAALLLAGAGLAQAQYLWIDAKGIKQYSDRPPPTSVPLKQILRAPNGQPSASSPPPAAAEAQSAALAPAAAASAPPAAGAKPAPSVAERNADFNKRLKDRAEASKKENEEQERRSAHADNCKRASSTQQALDGGLRIAQVNSAGERVVMDDNQRAAESKRIAKVMADCASSQ